MYQNFEEKNISLVEGGTEPDITHPYKAIVMNNVTGVYLYSL